jgi:hypothetical protein
VRDMVVLQIVATSHAAEPCVGSGTISGTLARPSALRPAGALAVRD